MLSLSHRFLFLHVPKTAGNAVQRALLPFSEDRIVRLGPHQDGVERFEIRSPSLEMHKHLSLAEYRDRLGSGRFAPLFRFCTVRNPWDRCLSFFFSPHRGRVTWSPAAFEAFIAQEIPPTVHYLRLDPAEADPFDNMEAILRFEHLAPDFAAVCDRLGLGRPPLSKVNVGEPRDYRRYYATPGLVDLVAEKFRHDIARFGYGFE